MNEYAHLINDYLCVNPTTFPYTNFLSITFEELGEALHNLQAFERPDMYSVLKDKIQIGTIGYFSCKLYGFKII